MNVLLLGGNLFLSCIFPIVLLLVGQYFKNHIHMEIGNQGIVTPSAKVSQEAWLYAQKIGGPKLQKYGVISLLITLLADVLILIFGKNQEYMFCLSGVIGFCAVIGVLMEIENAVKKQIEKTNDC